MDYYGLLYTIDDHTYVTIVEGIDHTESISPIVWTVGSICITTFQIMKYCRRSLVVRNEFDSHIIVRRYASNIGPGGPANYVKLDKLLEEYGVMSDKYKQVKQQLKEIAENDTIPSHSSVGCEWQITNGEWVSASI